MVFIVGWLQGAGSSVVVDNRLSITVIKTARTLWAVCNTRRSLASIPSPVPVEVNAGI